MDAPTEVVDPIAQSPILGEKSGYCSGSASNSAVDYHIPVPWNLIDPPENLGMLDSQVGSSYRDNVLLVCPADV